MNFYGKVCGWLAAIIVGLMVLSSPGSAAEETPPKVPVDLSGSKQQLFRDYERFEKSLFDVAEQVRRKDPERAELLYRARSQSQEQRILTEMQSIAELLRTQGPSGPVDPQLGPAADRQQEVVARLEAVLKVLQSLDERERVAAEIARIQDLLKETNKVIARQKDARAETQRGKQPERAKDAQKKVTKEAQKLADKIDRQDSEINGDNKPQAPQQGEQKPEGEKKGDKPSSEEGKPGEKKSDEAKPGEQKPGEEKSGEQKPGEQKSGEQGKPGDGKKSESGEPQKGDPSSPQQGGSEKRQQQGQQGGQKSEQGKQSGQQQQQKTAGREELEQARQKMQQAIEDLEKNQQKDALQNQDEAVKKLEELKAQLEEILRQLREDERESYLTLLEARFQNMLRRQQHINKETARLDAVPVADRQKQNVSSQVDTLRKEQDDNALEAEKAAHILKEEGSSVAFPEAVEQMHENMRVVVARLSKQEIGQTTQLVEQLIVETLEEMIASLRKELEKKQDKQQGQQGGQQGGPQDPSLVDQIAELKLIRSLQNQINRLTRQIGTELEGALPTDPDQMKLIQDIKVRQERIQEATYDLSVGRNK